MKIAILGDSHDSYKNLEEAVDVSNKNGCELMLHTGDLGAPGNSIEIISNFKGHIKMILGNNDHEIVGLMRLSQKHTNFEIIKTAQGGDSFEEEIQGVKFFMHHYPRIAELAARSGLFDVCIFGHTHKYHEEIIGKTLLLNPSSIIPNEDISSMVIYDTSVKEHQRIILTK